jgi:23S rRNA (uracil1939-C5)-methyltransferase
MKKTYGKPDRHVPRQPPVKAPVASQANGSSQFCAHFTKKKCGGCSNLNIPYQEQLKAKQAKVEALLIEALKFAPEDVQKSARKAMQPIVGSPKPMGYRASAKFCLHEDRYGHKAIGLYMQGSRVVVDTAGCPANVELANIILKKMFTKKSNVPARFYDHQGRVFQKGRFKFLTIRTSPSGKGTNRDAAVIISHTGIEKRALTKWLELSGLTDLTVYESRLTKADDDNFTGRYIDHVSGPETFPYLLNDQTYNLSPAAFFQANHCLGPGLIAGATSFREEGDVLLDLYSGFGAYSFEIAKRFKKIFVVDGNTAAIKTANAHAKAIGIEHLEGHAMFCEDFLESKLPQEMAARVTHVIVNPSRAGMSPRVVRRLEQPKLPHLKELHYVSCNPETLCRDIKLLLTHGLTLTSIQPFDMFPQTDHVEVVAKFSRNK